MAISTYADLTAAVGRWLSRSDLNSVIPDFISLAHAEINRQLRVRQMETEFTTVGTAEVDLPDGFRQFRRVKVETNPPAPLSYISDEDADAKYSGQTGVPKFYTIINNKVRLVPEPDGSYNVTFIYFKELEGPELDTNVVFQAHPDLYLFGALVQATPYLKNDARLPMWKQRYEEVKAQVQVENDIAVRSGSVIQMRPA